MRFPLVHWPSPGNSQSQGRLQELSRQLTIISLRLLPLQILRFLLRWFLIRRAVRRLRRRYFIYFCVFSKPFDRLLVKSNFFSNVSSKSVCFPLAGFQLLFTFEA